MASTITPISTPVPSRTDPDNFSPRMDTFLSELPTMVDETNVVIGEVNTNAVSSSNSAATAQSNATSTAADRVQTGLDAAAAAQSATLADAPAYSSGTTYSWPDIVAGSDGNTYRCISEANISGDDPVDSSGNWVKPNVPPTEWPLVKPTLNLNFAAMKTLDPRIEFTRDSNETYTNEKGLMAYAGPNEPCFDHDPITGECKGLAIWEARENLLKYTEDFSNAAWFTQRASIGSNSIVAPDETVTADKLIQDSSLSNNHYTRQDCSVTAGTTYTWSIYIKAADWDYIKLYLGDTGVSFNNAYIDINIASWAATLIGDGVEDYTIEEVGNGWYRCSVTGVAVATSTGGLCYVQFLNSSGNFVFDGDGTSGFYIWGAQLEVGAFPTPYMPSVQTFTSRASDGSYFDSDGLLQTATTDEARWNYNPLDLSIPPKLLLENASTNLTLQSHVFNSVTWAKTSVTATANYGTSPNGLVEAEKITENTSTTAHGVAQMISCVAWTTYTYSVYAKAVSRSNIRIAIDAAAYGESIQASFNLLSGEAVAGAGSPESGMEYIGNGWYRCWLFATATASASSGFRVYMLTEPEGTATYTGDGASSLFLWGAQMEEGQLSSYIPTLTSAETRAADVSTSATGSRETDLAEMTGTNFSDWYKQGEGTFHAISMPTTDDINCGLLAVGGPAANFGSGDYIYAAVTTSGVIQSLIYTIAGLQASIAPAIDIDEAPVMSHAFSFETGSAKGATNGTLSAEETDVVIPLDDMSNLSIGGLYYGWGSAAAPLNGHLSSLTYYPKALSSNELQIITQP